MQGRSLTLSMRWMDPFRVSGMFQRIEWIVVGLSSARVVEVPVFGPTCGALAPRRAEAGAEANARGCFGSGWRRTPARLEGVWWGLQPACPGRPPPSRLHPMRPA